MKAMVLGKIALVVLVLGVGLCAERPSEDEFNLFCRIFAETNDMMLEPDYIYDEGKDKEIVKEMQVLFNATTDNMDEFRKTLWVTKDFFEAHPPPTHPESRRRAHREIQNLIDKGEREIQDNRDLAEKINEKIEGAKLSVLQGIYGEHVKEVPKQDGKLSDFLRNPESTFEDHTNVTASCGSGENKAGKTLLNDFFCVCVGEAASAGGPCSGYLLPPKRTNNNCCKKDCCANTNCCGEKKDCCNCCWTQMNYESGGNEPLALTDSFEKIEKVCRGVSEEKKETQKMPALLEEYVKMIGSGGAKQKQSKTHMFGHSGWGAEDTNVKDKFTGCTGGGDNGGNGAWAKNANICVDYTKNKNGETYDIPWHNNFREAAEKMDQAQQLQDQILKNRADLLLLKSQAWVAYGREKDDETSNLDDMNEGITWERRAMAERKTEEREYIDVSQKTTEPSQPSQPVQGQGAPGNPPHYILISSTETSQPSPKKTDEGKGGGREEPEVTVISSESTTQEAASPSQGPSQATSQPPTQSAKRLREEKKTGE